MFYVCRQEWMERAYCATHPDPDRWYPPKGHSEKTRATKMLCKLCCPVRLECGIHAYDTGERHGIAAGFSVSNREGRKALAKWIEFEQEVRE